MSLLKLYLKEIIFTFVFTHDFYDMPVDLQWSLKKQQWWLRRRTNTLTEFGLGSVVAQRIKASTSSSALKQ